MLKNKHLFFFVSVSFVIFIINFVFVNNVYASVYKISFVSETQTLEVGQVSGPIKIEAEDQDSTTTKATETIYLNLSTSGNGEFSSNKDTWKSITTLSGGFSTSSVYISSGNSSRSFYYKGLTDGQHTITVSAKSKSGIVFDSVEQIINIGTVSSNICTSFTYSEWGICLSDTQERTILTQTPDGCSGGSPELTQSCTTSSTSTTTSTTTQTTKVVKRIVYVSAHSTEEDLSDYNEKTAFETSAGRERTTLVGSPIEFDAKYKLSQNIQCTPTFKWSYGDGLSAEGKIVNHTYKYPGEYQVVLNGVCGDYISVSRTIVKVNFPNVSVTNLANGDVEITNKNNIEINIGKWKINNGQKDFVFPEDTIISAGNKIIISKEDIFTAPSLYGFVLPVGNSSSSVRISMSNPMGREIAYFDGDEIEKQNTSLAILQKTVQSKIIENTQSLSSVVAKKQESDKKVVADIKLSVNKQTDKISNITPSGGVGESQDTKNVSQTATILESIKSTTTPSFWLNVINFPINGAKSFAHLFYNF